MDEFMNENCSNKVKYSKEASLSELNVVTQIDLLLVQVADVGGEGQIQEEIDHVGLRVVLAHDGDVVPELDNVGPVETHGFDVQGAHHHFLVSQHGLRLVRGLKPIRSISFWSLVSVEKIFAIICLFLTMAERRMTVLARLTLTALRSALLLGLRRNNRRVLEHGDVRSYLSLTFLPSLISSAGWTTVPTPYD